MASNLFNMLSDLAKSEKKLDEFKSDPDAVMTRYELSTKQKTLIKNAFKKNRQQDLLKALGDEVADRLKVCC